MSSIPNQHETVFGPYVLERKLGEGGMAVTYLARERVSGMAERRVAIKQVLPQLAGDAKFVEMFNDEMRVSVLLSHRNICRIFNAGVIDSCLYMAMEFIDGLSLAALLQTVWSRGIAFPPEHALYLVAEVLEGLHAAHTQVDTQGNPLGLVHRDVSPQNVLVSRQGEVKVIDFGVAKAASNSSKTRTGAVKGKILYLSPEQLQAVQLDARSDLYAAGLVLYQLLCGIHPFEGPDEHSTIYNFCTRQPLPPTQVAPHLPPQLDAVVMRALARDREQRYSSAAEMARALSDTLYSLHPSYRSYHFNDFVTWVLSGSTTAPPQIVPSSVFAHTGAAYDPHLATGERPASPANAAAPSSPATGPFPPSHSPATAAPPPVTPIPVPSPPRASKRSSLLLPLLAVGLLFAVLAGAGVVGVLYWRSREEAKATADRAKHEAAVEGEAASEGGEGYESGESGEPALEGNEALEAEANRAAEALAALGGAEGLDSLEPGSAFEQLGFGSVSGDEGDAPKIRGPLKSMSELESLSLSPNVQMTYDQMLQMYPLLGVGRIRTYFRIVVQQMEDQTQAMQNYIAFCSHIHENPWTAEELGAMASMVMPDPCLSMYSMY